MPEKPKVYIQTFYGFDVFVNGRVIYFPSKKSKELLAILINQRGGSVSLAQVYIFYMKTLRRAQPREISEWFITGCERRWRNMGVKKC